MKKIDLNQHSSLNQSPFRVPEGYFEDFHSRLMAELPEIQTKKKPANIFRMQFKTRLIVAFSAVAIFCAVFYVFTLTDRNINADPTSQVLSAKESGQLIDEFCDYTRIQSSDIYYYVTSESSE